MTQIIDHFQEMRKRKQALLLKCSTFFFFVFLLCSICLAQSSDRYHCSDGYFSFTPPDNWRVVDTKDMSGRYKNKLYRVGKRMDSCPLSGTLMAVCNSTVRNSSELPLIFIYRSYLVEESEIELEKDWISSESKIKDYLLSERKQKEIQRKRYGADFLPADVTIKGARYAYDQSVHTAFEELQCQMNGTDIVRVTATILGSRTRTTVFCQSQKNKNMNPGVLIRQIAGSFEYDAGYEFGVPNPNRMDSHQRMKKKAKGSLMKFCVFSLVLLLGLFFFRIVSGDYIPIIGMVVATISGELVFQIMGWLVWQVGFMAGYERHGFLPFIAAITVMAPIIWKWPGSEISFTKSIVAVGSLFFLASSMVFLLMGIAMAGVMYLPFLLIPLVIVIYIWRLDF